MNFQPANIMEIKDAINIITDETSHFDSKIVEFDCVLDCIEQLRKRLISIRKKKKEIFYMKHHR